MRKLAFFQGNNSQNHSIKSLRRSLVALAIRFSLIVLAVHNLHAVDHGYVTAVLRSENPPTVPPPVGETVVGTDFVIMTVADGDPMDWQFAEAVVTDAVFQSLMPFYCALPWNA